MSGGREWYLPHSQELEAKGPYTTEQIYNQLREGLLRFDDFCYCRDFEPAEWRRIIEIEDFHGALLENPQCPLPKLFKQGSVPQKFVFEAEFAKAGEYGEQNLYRRFPRVPIQADAIIHNEKNYCKGATVDISEKGVFVQTRAVEAFEKGEEVMVTLRSTSLLGTVSIPSVVLRVLQKGDREGFGIYFLRLNPVIKREIARYVLEILRGDSQLEQAG